MKTDSVNNNRNYCPLLGAAAGGIAGSGFGWYSKPFLKGGNLTDEFINTVFVDVSSALKTKNPDDYSSLEESLDIYKDFKEDGWIDNNDIDSDFKGKVNNYWDRSKKEFKCCGSREKDVKTLETLKNAAGKIQGKYAVMYGLIGAFVGGILGHLWFGSKKS